MDISVRIAGEGDVGLLAILRRSWNEENAGGPIDAPGFNAAFRAWWDAEHPTRTAHLRLAPSPRSVSFYERLGYTAGAVVELDPPPQ